MKLNCKGLIITILTVAYIPFAHASGGLSDYALSYGINGLTLAPDQRLKGVVIFCPSTDGTITAQNCNFNPSAGNNSPSTPATPGYIAPATGATFATTSNQLPASGSGLGGYFGTSPSLGTLRLTCLVNSPGAYRVVTYGSTPVVLAYDDGAGNSTSYELLDPGAGQGRQGASTSPEMGWFKGRIRMYGDANASASGRSDGGCS
jgi:hypothetical protein